ncbi:probable U2 small nuclear ribonucleoprotein A' [Saccostrea echinata]|uniref:probable U2 small nuclear ribonucleoprotein A' n=1 Tax=Saccostrea echinata TaxID=191078 RepID=UPI002A7FCBDA|nr:probable U2 small nuclear ribonucleoprotein A' [Saccostrea echinata]
MRKNLAYQDLDIIPPNLAETEGESLQEIDLTHNKISDLRFLIDFPRLTCLVLDHNSIESHVKIPTSTNLQTLWVNHNKIKNLGLFISTLCKSCPNLKFLSMMNNEAAPSYFNGGTYQQYMDYRHFVIAHFPKLEVLDDKKIEENERSEAKRIYRRKVSTSKQKSLRKKSET